MEVNKGMDEPINVEDVVEDNVNREVAETSKTNRFNNKNKVGMDQNVKT